MNVNLLKTNNNGAMSQPKQNNDRDTKMPDNMKNSHSSQIQVSGQKY